MFEAYSIGVRIRLIDSVSAGLVSMAGQFAAFNRHVTTSQTQLTALETKLRSIRGLALGGGMALGAGMMGLGMFEAPIKAAREYDLVLNKFKNLNLGDSINTQADNFARSANVMGVSAKQLMQTLTETTGIFGNYAEAAKLAPSIAAINAANAAVYQGKVGAIDEGGSRALMQFIDRRGGTKTDADFKRNLDLAEKLVTGSGGFLKFGDLAAFSQQAGTPFRALSDQGVLNYAGMMQEQGGRRSGTALFSLYQNLVAGRTPAKTLLKLQEYGIGKTSWQTQMTAAGRPVNRLVMQHPIDEALLQSDPLTWFGQDFIPLLNKHGVTSQAEMLRVTNDLLSNRLASSQASIMSTQQFQMLRDARITTNAMGYQEVIAAWQKDPNAAFANMAARWNDTLVTLGNDTLPMVVKGVEGLNASMQTMTGLMNQFPRLTSGLTVGVGALLGLATIGGTLALAKAGFQALGAVLTLGKGAGMGAQLLEVAGGLGGLASVLGKAGLVGAVGTAAYLGTRLVADSVTPKDWTFGGWLYDQVHGAYDPNAPASGVARGLIARGAAQSPFARDTSGRAATPTIKVYVNNTFDRNGIATMVTQEQAEGMGRPQTGLSEFDGTMSLSPAGGVGSY